MANNIFNTGKDKITITATFVSQSKPLPSQTGSGYYRVLRWENTVIDLQGVTKQYWHTYIFTTMKNYNKRAGAFASAVLPGDVCCLTPHVNNAMKFDEKPYANSVSRLIDPDDLSPDCIQPKPQQKLFAFA